MKTRRKKSSAKAAETSAVSPLFTASGQNTRFCLPTWKKDALLCMFRGDEYKLQLRGGLREATHGWGWSLYLGRDTLTLCDVTGADYWHHSCTKQMKKINFTHLWDFTARPETQISNNLNLIWIDILHTLRWTVACSHASVYTYVTDSEVLGSLASVKQTTPLFLCYNLNTVSNNLTVCIHTKHAGTHAHTLSVRMQVFRFVECIFLLMMV